MGVSLLAVRLTGPEERRHGTWFGNQPAYDAMAKASVPIPSIRGLFRNPSKNGPALRDKVKCPRLIIHNSMSLLDRLMRIIGTSLVMSVLWALLCADVVFSETVPSAESILDEAIELVVPPAKVGDADSLLEIAIRQAKVRSCEKAQDLFSTAINLNETWAKEKTDNLRIKAHIGFLSGLVAAQRRAGCVKEMKSSAERLLVLYQQRDQQHLGGSADNELQAAFYRLKLELDLGSLYLEMGESESARALLPSIHSGLGTAEWSLWREFRSAAVLLASMGHDAEALEIISLHETFYDARPDRPEDFNKKFFWMRRLNMLADVAGAQAEAGHREAAQATLRQAIEKARRTPVARLTEIYGEGTAVPVEGEPELQMIGEGNALQSAGLMRIVFVAAEMGETGLALEAFELASPLANQTGATGTLIQALAQKGEMATAQKLLDRFQCSSGAITQGLLDRHDWAGALEAYEIYQKSSCCIRKCNFGNISLTDLGKARTFVRGPTDTLTWARNQTKDYRVYALLGVIDALVEQNQLAAPPAAQEH